MTTPDLCACLVTCLDSPPGPVKLRHKLDYCPLHAAAPDLADALVDARKHMEEEALKVGLGNAGDLCPCFGRIRAALEKAERAL